MSKFEPGKEYKTRDGNRARVYATDGGGRHPIHGAIWNEPWWEPEAWEESGRYDGGVLDPRGDSDLMPEAEELWSVYDDDGDWRQTFDNRGWAEDFAKRNDCPPPRLFREVVE